VTRHLPSGDQAFSDALLLALVLVLAEKLADRKLNVAEVTQSEIGQKQKLQTVLEAVHDLLRPHGWALRWNVDGEWPLGEGVLGTNLPSVFPHCHPSWNMALRLKVSTPSCCVGGRAGRAGRGGQVRDYSGGTYSCGNVLLAHASELFLAGQIRETLEAETALRSSCQTKTQTPMGTNT
jgi:hypothetical protein